MDVRKEAVVIAVVNGNGHLVVESIVEAMFVSRDKPVCRQRCRRYMNCKRLTAIGLIWLGAAALWLHLSPETWA